MFGLLVMKFDIVVTVT